jgi:nucleoside-diphosphate-sugar epimerase
MIFVIGGNGFVGSGFARHLQSQGIAVTVVDRTNYDQLIGAECDILINANGNSKKFLAKDDPKEEFQASVASVRNSLVDFKFKKYVFLSTSDVYPDCSKPELTREDISLNVAEQSPYGFHKHLAELCVQHAAKDWLIIRQGGFVGQGIKKNAVFDVLHGEKLWVHPDSRFQYINTEDSARLVIQLIGKNISNEIFNLTATGTVSVREIMQLADKVIPHDTNDQPLCYEISTEKVQRYVALPTTLYTLRTFFQDAREIRKLV